MKQLLILFLILINSISQSQITDGQRNNSQGSPRESQVSDLNSNALQNEVNLFNGVFTSIYNLGSVKTLEGLEYSLNLKYASKFSGGDNVPVTSGIPYGEGWNVNIPSITIDNNSFHNYSEQEELQFDQPFSGGILRKNMTREQLMKEGGLYWFSPYISIPGVVSERFVFKYFDDAGNRAIFVPHKFEQYVEAKFDGQYWEVISSNGNTYRFDVVQVSSNNSSNQRIQVIDPSQAYDMDLMYNLVVPKSQIVGWYCSEISNPTHTAGQKIYFEYEKFGDFNFFKEYYDSRTAATIGDEFRGPYRICLPWACKCLETASSLLNYTAYKEIILKRVLAASYSTVLEELELNYQTVNIRALGAQNVLHPGDADVSRKDSLYNFKTVYSAGIGPNAVSSSLTESLITESPVSQSGDLQFSGWQRYRHIKANGSFVPNVNENLFSNGKNPYLAEGANGQYYCRSSNLNLNGYDLPFSHGFLESPRIQYDNYGNEIAAGDIYEVKALIRNDNLSISPGDGFCNFDINVVSGLDKFSQTFNPGLGSSERPVALTIDDSKSYSVFTTFNQPVKWNSRSSLNTQHPGYLITSNFFTLPNLPAEYEGLQIQVGPSNSDHDFSRQPNSMGAYLDNSNIIIPASSKSYYGNLPSWGVDDLYPTSPIPMNFGAGLPWQMMERFYSKYDDGNLDFRAPRNRHWWNGGPNSMGWNNEPTLSGENVYLAGLALIRYSKNSYMLSSVVKYQTNGEISPVSSPGRVAVSKVEMRYTVKSDTLLNNIVPGVFTPQQLLHGVHNSVLLKEIITVPVNGSENNQPIVFQYDELPRMFFNYSQVRTSNYQQTRDNKFYYPLTECVNQLGGITKIEYYGFGQGSANTGIVKFKKDPKDILSASGVVETNLAVKRISYEKEDNDFAEWNYTYEDVIRLTNSPINSNIKKHFYLEYTDSEVGFKRTVVTAPPAGPGHPVNKTVYNHYDDLDPLFFGKLKSTEKFDHYNRLISKSELLYGFDLAFKNGVFRSNYKKLNTTDDYGDVTFSPTYAGSLTYPVNYDVPVNIGNELIRSFEVTDARNFNESYLQSYFIRLQRQVNTEYDYPERDRLYDVLNSSVLSGFAGNFNNPVDAEPINPNPVGRIGICQFPVQPVLLTSITDFTYWNADWSGNTSSPGFKLLIPEFSQQSFNLRFEPSWKLYSQRKSSKNLEEAFEKEEHFYYYDLKNFDADLNRPSFQSVYQSILHQLRDLEYESRITTKYLGLDSVSKSRYVLYRSNWNDNTEDLLPTETVPYIGPLTCPGNGGSGNSSGSGSSSTGNVPSDCIRAFNPNVPPPQGYELRYYNTIPFYCPISLLESNTTSNQRLIIYNQDPGIPNIGHWVNGKLKYTSSVLQVGDQIRSDYQTIQRKPKSGILAFKEVVLNNISVTIPEFPYDTLRVDSILERNEFGLEKLVSNESGLLTKFQYSQPWLRYYTDLNNPCNSYTAVFWKDIFGPQKIILGFGLAEEQAESYEYRSDNSIYKITTLNNEVVSFNYDEFGRLKQKFINNKLYDQYRYSCLHNSDLVSFDQRVIQNYIDHWRVNSSNSILHTRQYVDPAGRLQQELSQETTGLNTLGNSLLCSGEKVYDRKDRLVKEFKPFYLVTPNQLSFFPRNNSNDPTRPQQFKENIYKDEDGRDELTISSDYDVNALNGHVRQFSTELLDRTRIINELGLSANEQSLVIGSSADLVVTKSSSRDQDGKKTITYKNAFGQLIAEKRYASQAIPVVTLYCVDNFGNLGSVINPEKQQISYRTNMLGLKYLEIHPDKGRTAVMYNRSGQPVVIQDANGSAGRDNNSLPYCRVISYDEFGRVISQEKADITGFNPVGYEQDQQNPFYEFSVGMTCSWIMKLPYQVPGGSLLKNYDGILIDRTLEKSIHYDNHVTPGYFAGSEHIHPQLLTVLPSVQKNLKGRKSWTCQFTNGIPLSLIFMGYDSVGNISNVLQQFSFEGITQTTPGIINKIGYPEYNRNSANLKTTIDHNADGIIEQEFNYQYDSRGRIVKVESSGISANIRYNEVEQMVEQVKYNDHRHSVCDGLTVDITNYQYDVRGRLKEINSRFYNEKLKYDGEQLPGIGNYMVPVNGFNFNGNINAIRSSYLGQASGTMSILLPTDQGFRYDQLNRLSAVDATIYDGLSNGNNISAKYKYGDETLNYDKIGNIETLNRWYFYSASNLAPENDRNSWSYHYSPGSSRLMLIDSASSLVGSYSYDENGNMLTDSRREIVMSEFNSADLPCVLSVSGEVVNYAYDVNDKRIYKYDPVAGVKEYYLRDLDGNELGIVDMNTGSWKYYLNGPFRFAEIGSDITMFEYDHLGNTRVAYTSQGDCNTGQVSFNIKGVYDYYSTGKTLRSYVSGDRSRFLSTGNERDQETGLDFRNARFSDPDIGVFRGVDSERNKFLNFSSYTYSSSNPILLKDPSGNASDEFNVDLCSNKIIKVGNKGGRKTDYYNVINDESEVTQTFEIERNSGSINIFRVKEGANSTASLFHMPGTELSGSIIEPGGPSTKESGKDKRVPEGTYSLTKNMGTKFPDDYRIYNEDVPISRAIVIHRGSNGEHTLGCLLPGEFFVYDRSNQGEYANKYKTTRWMTSLVSFYIELLGPENVKLNINNIIPR